MYNRNVATPTGGTAAQNLNATAQNSPKVTQTLMPLVFDQNPLDNLRNFYTITMVMKSGALYRTADIRKAIGYGTPAVP